MTGIVNEVAKTFDDLLEVHDFLSGQKPGTATDSGTPDLEKAADEILKIDQGKATLAIDRDIVKRIIRWLRSGKNVILVGAPGVGKTRLARRILEVEGKRVTGSEEQEIVVAHYEWTRRNVIGGLDLNKKFVPGCVTVAAERKRWLLIDEFNRADINKAFGEMFLAIESNKITLSPEEGEARKNGDKIEIPDEFQMIGTMNDFDKNLLLTELSFGLITRFVFVDIKPEESSEEKSVKDQILEDGKISDAEYNSCQQKITNFYKFIKEVRAERMIGVRSCIDIIRYVVSAQQRNKKDIDNFLDEALCDCLLPQFDRLDKQVISATIAAGEKHVPEAKEFVASLKKIKKQLDEATSWMSPSEKNSETTADGTNDSNNSQSKGKNPKRVAGGKRAWTHEPLKERRKPAKKG